MGLRGRRTIAGVLEGLEHVFGGFLGAFFLGFAARGTILGVLKGSDRDLKAWSTFLKVSWGLGAFFWDLGLGALS